VRILLPLVVILALIAIFGFWLARRRTREMIHERRRVAALQDELDVWVEAERKREETGRDS
jgi:cytochrome c oxidase assembly factor CtaG